MKLLVFAHRGEAQAFFKEMRPVAFDSPWPSGGLFRWDAGYFLIAGEGPWRALEKVCSALGTLTTTDAPVTEVWNLGIAGALGTEIVLGEIYPLRTLYALAPHNLQIQFESFSSSWGRAKIDCVSSPVRILGDEAANEANNFAPLVDCEAWSIARACRQFGLPFYPVKLASDRPRLASTDSCQLSRDNAEEWSGQLYRWFLEWSRPTDEQRPNPVHKLAGKEQWPGCYFTVTSERELQRLAHALQAKGVDTVDIRDLFEREEAGRNLTPKQRGKRLLKLLRRLLNPVQDQIQREIQESVRPLRQAGFQVGLDADLEKEQLLLRARVNNVAHLQRLQQGLARFSFDRFSRLMGGNLDV